MQKCVRVEYDSLSCCQRCEKFSHSTNCDQTLGLVLGFFGVIFAATLPEAEQYEQYEPQGQTRWM